VLQHMTLLINHHGLNLADLRATEILERRAGSVFRRERPPA
jgi:Fe-S cluster biosynthesis and repair protein YggX